MEPGCPAPLPSCRHLRRARRRAARSTAHPLSLSESPAMSVAFRRESDDEHKEPEFELPIPVGPNLVTPRGNRLQIGQASCRERVCRDVWISVVDVSLKKKTT